MLFLAYTPVMECGEEYTSFTVSSWIIASKSAGINCQAIDAILPRWFENYRDESMRATQVTWQLKKWEACFCVGIQLIVIVIAHREILFFYVACWHILRMDILTPILNLQFCLGSSYKAESVRAYCHCVCLLLRVGELVMTVWFEFMACLCLEPCHPLHQYIVAWPALSSTPLWTL